MKDLYLIWSNEHRAWWRPDSFGYSPDIRGAGVYSRNEARDICDKATFDWTHAPNEIVVRMEDLPDEPLMMLAVQLGIA